MAFEAFTTFTQLTAVGTSWTTLGSFTATPRELIGVFIGADNESGTVTDALEVRVLVARDDTPTNYTTEPIYARSYKPSAVTAEWFSFELLGYKHYRIQVKSAGSTDSYTVDGAHRGDGVDAT